ncbi:MAG: hydroxymethylbilane synthase [Gammaproteobacteria bacterium]
MPPVIIAARQSPLAVRQAEIVAAALAKRGADAAIKTFSTLGDEIINRPLADIGGKELFVKKLQSALVAGEADIAVHSLKDMAARGAAEFCAPAAGFAEDARDVFVSEQYRALREMPAGAAVGTSSPRRAALLREYFPHLTIAPVRGNVQRRIAQMQSGACGGLLLAAAGLRRLNLWEERYELLPAAQFIPAPGQGVLAAECLASRRELTALLARLSDPVCMARAAAERAFAAAAGGDCHTPLGAHAEVCGDEIRLSAFYAGGGHFRQTQTTAPREEPEAAGRKAAEILLK